LNHYLIEIVDDSVLLGTISVGAACFPEDGATGEKLLRAAGAAMYRAKEAGRDLFYFLRR
jgi:diguanylate cyclase (GGDEF)-like protein